MTPQILEQLAQILHQKKAQEMQASMQPSPEMVSGPQAPPLPPMAMPNPQMPRPDPMTRVEQDRISMLEGQRDQLGAPPEKEGFGWSLLRNLGQSLAYGDKLPQARMQEQQLKRQKMMDLANEAEQIRSGVRQRGQDQLQTEQSNRLNAQEERTAAMFPVEQRMAEAQASKLEAPPAAVQPREIDVFTNSEGKRVVVRQMPDGTLKAEAQGAVAGPQQIPGRDIPLPQDVADQRVAMETATQRPAAPAQRNIDPLSPEGIAAQQELAKVREQAKTSEAGSFISPYSKERTTRALADIEDARKSVSGWSTGMGAEALATLGGNDARKLQGKLNTLKASIMQNELAQMRQSSKTGGALGQVSDREGRLLESSLAALDQGLEGADLIEELDKAKASIERWTKEMEKAPKQPAGGGSGGKAPQGVDQAVWDVMTPQERALWQN